MKQFRCSKCGLTIYLAESHNDLCPQCKNILVETGIDNSDDSQSGPKRVILHD